MAKISQFSRVKFEVNSLEKVFITKHTQNNVIVLTALPKTVAVVQLSSGRIEKDWSVKSGSQLTTPVIYSNHNNQYSAVLDNKYLHTWSNDDPSIEKSSKIKLGRAVERLFTAADGSVHLLYPDGTFSRVDRPDEQYGQVLLSEAQRLLWTDTSHGVHGTVVTLVTAAKDSSASNGHIKVHSYVLPRDTSHARLYTHEQHQLDAKWVCSCLQEGKTGTFLISLWSNGKMTQRKVSDCLSPHTEDLPPIPGLVTSMASITAIDQSQVVVSGIKTDQGCDIGIWDVNFGILKTSRNFPESMHKTKLHVSASGLLFVASPVGCYSAVASAPATSLAAVLALRPPETARSVDFTPHSTALVAAAERIVSQDVHFKEAFREFIALLQQHTENVLLVSKHISELLKKWEARASDNKAFCMPIEELRVMIGAGLIQSSDLPVVLTLLSRDKHVSLVHECLSKVKDVSESCLVRAAALYLACPETRVSAEMSSAADDSISELEGCELSKYTVYLLNHIVRLPVNVGFLTDQLHTLNFSNAMALLGYLCALLDSACEYTEGTTCLPKTDQVVEWLSCLLDAHLTQLVLAQDARATLVALHQSVSNRVLFLQEMSNLDALLTQIKQRYELPRLKQMGHYCIETLHIA